MCGRYRIKDPKQVCEWMEVEDLYGLRPRYNVAPTQTVPVVTARGQLQQMQWGIVPKWADVKSRALINARSETVREKRSFKTSFVQRRCMVPADGFYEWTKIGKRPHLFTLKNDAPFAIAAIWETCEEIPRCCLLTTSANSVLEPIHDRMPVIIRREDWDEWFSTDELVEQSFTRITTPYVAEEMSALAVSPIVNSARIDDPRCCEPVPPMLAI